MSAQPQLMGPECIYAKPCFAVCTNPNCRKPGLICEYGFTNRQQCSLFHEGCSKVKWSQIQSHIYNNPALNSPDFHYMKDKIDNMFINLINKIKAEHSKFRIWVKTYGHNIQVMKFIKNLTEHDYSHINGANISPILNQIFSPKKVQIPNIVESEVVGLQMEINQLLQKVSDLYLKPGTKKQRQATSHPSIQQIKPNPHAFESRIVHDVSSIHRLFQAKVASLKLIFRASQHNYSIKQFHKKCDGQAGTITIIETQFGKIIGGYTPIAWSSAKKQWAADKTLKSFIFSLNMRQKFNLNLVQFAIANNPDKGPIFGCCDICIVDNSNKQRSNAEFPISYNNGKYVRSPESSFAFTGHPKGQFLIKQWQMFKVQFE